MNHLYSQFIHSYILQHNYKSQNKNAVGANAGTAIGPADFLPKRNPQKLAKNSFLVEREFFSM